MEHNEIYLDLALIASFLLNIVLFVKIIKKSMIISSLKRKITADNTVDTFTQDVIEYYITRVNELSTENSELKNKLTDLPKTSRFTDLYGNIVERPVTETKVTKKRGRPKKK
jgi:hypothetical protein